MLIESAPRLLNREPNRICTHMTTAAICCSRPARWRAKKDSLSLICFLFLMLLLPVPLLIWPEPGTCQNFSRFRHCLCKSTITEPYYSDLVVPDLRRRHERDWKHPDDGEVCMPLHLSCMERGLIVSQCIALLGMAATGINMTAKDVVAKKGWVLWRVRKHGAE